MNRQGAVLRPGVGDEMAPGEGFEPPAKRLTAACSTTELPGISACRPRPGTTNRPYNRALRSTPPLAPI